LELGNADTVDLDRKVITGERVGGQTWQTGWHLANPP
jgi:hypothetical protein